MEYKKLEGHPRKLTRQNGLQGSLHTRQVPSGEFSLHLPTLILIAFGTVSTNHPWTALN